jgi:predicted Na+-dependent transporter
LRFEYIHPTLHPPSKHLSITQTTTLKTHQTKTGFQIISAVFVLHSSGFFLGYTISKALGLPERICRTNSIEVGMQSSALAAVLAKVHFRE